jgi:hypothetical protein
MKEPSSFSLPKLDLYLLEKTSFLKSTTVVGCIMLHPSGIIFEFCQHWFQSQFFHGFSVLDSSILFRSMDTPMLTQQIRTSQSEKRWALF